MAKHPDIIMHIGAHKTATTHLQQSLQAARPQLRNAGVHYFGPTQLRATGSTLANRFALPFSSNKAAMAEDPKQSLRDMAGKSNRLVISEENFVGVLSRTGTRPTTSLYPYAVERIAALASAIAPDGMDLFLGTRAPATYLNSVFSQVLIAGGRASQKNFKAANSLQSVDWADYVARLAKLQQLRSLTVWAYEDYAALFGRITALMLGAEPAKLIAWSSARSHKGLSQRAVQEILAGDTSKKAAKLAKDKYPAGDEYPAQDIFSGAEHANSGLLYASQIEAIAQMPKVNFLRV